MKKLTYDEWSKWRSSGITGSEAPIIMKKSPWATPMDLFMRRTGQMPAQPLNFPMRRGLKLEPEARERYEAMTGVEVPARLLEAEQWSVARASFDGLNEDAEVAIEIKCPGKEDHLLALKGKVPEKYVFQLVHQIFVSGYKSIDYVSYNPSFPPQHQFARVVFMRDEKLERELLAEERRFWNCLRTNTPPEKPKVYVGKAAASKKTDWTFPVRKSRAMIPPR